MRTKLPPETVIAVDFDGTCVTSEFPMVGRDIGAQTVLRRIVADGGKIVLWTMRSGQPLMDAVEWFKFNGIPLYGVNRNPTQDEWTNSPKCHAKLYIDDAALGCPLLPGREGERPHVNWAEVAKLLWPGLDLRNLLGRCTGGVFRTPRHSQKLNRAKHWLFF